MEEFLTEAAELQRQYKILLVGNSFTKKALCEICIPFRDKWKLSDLDVLDIAREKKSLSDIIDIYKTISSISGL